MGKTWDINGPSGHESANFRPILAATQILKSRLIKIAFFLSSFQKLKKTLSFHFSEGNHFCLFVFKFALFGYFIFTILQKKSPKSPFFFKISFVLLSKNCKKSLFEPNFALICNPIWAILTVFSHIKRKSVCLFVVCQHQKSIFVESHLISFRFNRLQQRLLTHKKRKQKICCLKRIARKKKERRRAR